MSTLALGRKQKNKKSRMQIKNARIEKIDTKCAFGQFKYSITIDYKLQNSDSD